MKKLTTTDMKKITGGTDTCMGNCSFSGPSYSVPYAYVVSFGTRQGFIDAVCPAGSSNAGGFSLTPACEIWELGPEG